MVVQKLKYSWRSLSVIRASTTEINKGPLNVPGNDAIATADRQGSYDLSTMIERSELGRQQSVARLLKDSSRNLTEVYYC